MKTKFVAVLALLGALVFTAAAADVTGKYSADVPGRQGNTQTTTFNLKADGSALSGTVTNPRGDTPIADGKVDGDSISFTTTMKMGDNEVKLTYTGKVKGDSIDFTRTREGADQSQKFTAKKQ
jgi:hypothetical protein